MNFVSALSRVGRACCEWLTAGAHLTGAPSGRALPFGCSAACLLLVATLSAPLRAEESVTLETLEITARKTDAERWRLPVAVTAYSGDWLGDNGIVNYRELARVVPGLFVMEQAADNVSLNLRGLTSDTGDPRVQPRVSVFQDGVLLSNAHGHGVALFDVAEVAVFKGPQATQFGRGVQGGAIAFTSRRATAENSGELTLEVGDYAAVGVGAVVNRVVVPAKLFARVAVQANQRDGYITNRADGEELQGEGTLAARTSLHWQPAATTTADLIFSYQREDVPTIAAKNMVGVPGFAPFDTNPFTATTLNRGSELGATRTIVGLTGLVRHELNAAWTLTSTSAWRTVEADNEFDIDGSPYYLLEVGERFDGEQFSQELRFAYDDGGKFTGAVGAALFGTHDTQSAIIRTDENVLWRFLTGTPPPFAFNPRYSERNTGDTHFTTGEVFGRGDYQVTERLTFGGGLRLTRDRVATRYRSYLGPIPGTLAGLVPTSGNGNNFFRSTSGWLENSTKLGAWAGQVDARYVVTPRLTTYATVSRGRHTPVLDFNGITLAALKHAEETVWNFEVGLKGASANRRIRYEASVFQYHFEHFQTQRVSAFGVAEPFDGGRARGRGVEAAVHADVAGALTVFATYGFTDAEFSATDENGRPQLFAGDTFRLTSRHVVSLGGTATWALAGRGAFFLTPLYTYRSEYFFEDDNGQNGGILRQDGYGLLNVRLGYRPAHSRWEVVAYVNNVLDKRYLLDAGNIGAAYGLPTSIPAAPRMLGVKATWGF